MLPYRDIDAGSWDYCRVLVLTPTPTHPQDAGNRHRIYRICKVLKDAGAQLTVLHYPAEWMAHARFSNRSMRLTWGEYYEVPPTRPSHQPPAGVDHTIDEWWDASIEEYLKWLFRSKVFDVFIVNYTWLSKALELAPPNVLKVLDTHDQFAGRRQLLASIGIEPEFFYTTKEQERIAFGRADLIWAIKDQEKEAFSGYTDTPVVVVPHLDLASPLKVAPEEDSYLRVGIIGSRNNINVQNISEFLLEAVPALERNFAPVKLIVAGSICEALRDIRSPTVHVVGSVDDMRTVYATVDVVLVPMIRSTGLKIRVGEALSLGMPVVSTEHAFEGYVATHPFHRLSAIGELAGAIASLAFDRSELPRLREASRTAYEFTLKKIEAGLLETRDRYLSGRKTVLVAVHSNAFDSRSILSIVARSTIEHISWLGTVTVVVVAGDPATILKNRQLIDQVGQIAVSSEIVHEESLRQDLLEAGVIIASVDELCQSLVPIAVIFDASPEEERPLAGHPVHMILRPAVAALSQTTSSYFNAMRPWLATAASNCLASSVDTLETAEWSAANDAEQIRAPVLKDERWLHGYSAWRAKPRYGLLLLLVSRWSSELSVVHELLRKLRFEVIVATPTRRKTAEYSDSVQRTTAVSLLSDLLARKADWPEIVVDMSYGHIGLQVLAEVLSRKRIPCFTLHPGLSAPAALPPDSLHFYNHLGDLTAILMRYRWRRQIYQDMQPVEFDTDGGWASIWQRLSGVASHWVEPFTG